MAYDGGHSQQEKNRSKEIKRKLCALGRKNADVITDDGSVKENLNSLGKWLKLINFKRFSDMKFFCIQAIISLNNKIKVLLSL